MDSGPVSSLYLTRALPVKIFAENEMMPLPLGWENFSSKNFFRGSQRYSPSILKRARPSTAVWIVCTI